MRPYDVIVVGAGPGGATAAALAAGAGLRTLVLDRSTFPRDKVCGDAVSGKSMGVMRRLGVDNRIDRLPYEPVRGVTFGGPGGDIVRIPFHSDELPGFVCRRKVFDQVLVDAAAAAGAELREGAEVRRVIFDKGRVVGVGTRQGDYRAPIVVGADGAYSVVARQLGMGGLVPRHYVAGIRSYYEGMAGDGNLELYFVDDVLPGYFWIFSLPNGGANVGLGMLSATIKRRDIRLKPLLDLVVRSERFRDRFAHARRLGPVVGWGLPLGSRPRRMAGDGWMLVGDAASLIDPFSGEGIGNAMLSGMHAAEWAHRATEKEDFSATFLMGYERQVVDVLKRELRLSHALQRVLSWRGLLDLVIRKASRSDEIASALSCMFDDLGARRRLLSPKFYWSVLRS